MKKSAKLYEKLLEEPLTNEQKAGTLNNIMLPKPFTLNDKICNVQSWIEEQISYFRSKSKERHDKFEKLESVEKVLYKLGLVVLLVLFTVYLLDVYSKSKFVANYLWSLPDMLEHAPLTYIWHKLVLLSSFLLLLAAFIGEKYVKSEGYEEDIYHFNSMLSDFLAAQKALEKVEKGSEEYKGIIFDLGLKALSENSKWVVLHDRMRAEPSFE